MCCLNGTKFAYSIIFAYSNKQYLFIFYVKIKYEHFDNILLNKDRA